MTGIGQRIHRAARAVGSQQALADKLGVSVRTINKYVQETTSPQIDTLEKIAEASGLSLMWLIKGDGSAEPNPNAGDQLNVEAVKKIAGLISLFLAENKLQLPHAEFVNLTLTLYQMSDGQVDSEEVLTTLKNFKP